MLDLLYLVFFFFFLYWVCNQLFMIDVGFFFSLVGLLYYFFFFLESRTNKFFFEGVPNFFKDKTNNFFNYYI